MYLISTLIILLSSLLYCRFNYLHDISPPKNLSYTVIDNFVTENQVMELRSLWEEYYPVMELPSINWPMISSIGEEFTPSANGSCPFPELILHTSSKKCVASPRSDYIKHYFFTGGYNGWKESYERLLLRSSTFAHHEYIDLNKKFYQIIHQQTTFQQIGQKFCPIERLYLRPVSFSLYIHLPGQNLIPHYDISYFYGITRQIYPHYLVLAIDQSGLFNDYKIPMIQSITYIHDWDPLHQILDNYTNETDTLFKNSNIGGDLVFYNNGVDYNPTVKMIIPKRSVFFDGSKIVHASSTYKPWIDPPSLNKKLMFRKNVNKWELFVNNITSNKYYGWNEIRAAITWRSLCFHNKSEATQYNPFKFDSRMNLNHILNIFIKDLMKKGKIKDQNEAKKIPKINLIQLIVSTYIKYPKSRLGLIPFNYCIWLQSLANIRWIKHIISFICHF